MSGYKDCGLVSCRELGACQATRYKMECISKPTRRSEAYHNPESREAYDSIKERLSDMEERVMNYIRHQTVSTCEQVEDALRMKHQTASAVINALMKKQQLEIIPERGTTRSGRSCRIYRVRERKPQSANYEFPF